MEEKVQGPISNCEQKGISPSPTDPFPQKGEEEGTLPKRKTATHFCRERFLVLFLVHGFNKAGFKQLTMLVENGIGDRCDLRIEVFEGAKGFQVDV